MYDKEARGKIIENYAKKRDLELEQEKLMEHLQVTCDHDSIIEFNPGNGTLRICIICLKKESSPNYKTLKTSHFEGSAHPRNNYDKLKPLKMILTLEEE